MRCGETSVLGGFYAREEKAKYFVRSGVSLSSCTRNTWLFVCWCKRQSDSEGKEQHASITAENVSHCARTKVFLAVIHKHANTRTSLHENFQSNPLSLFSLTLSRKGL